MEGVETLALSAHSMNVKTCKLKTMTDPYSEVLFLTAGHSSLSVSMTDSHLLRHTVKQNWILHRNSSQTDVTKSQKWSLNAKLYKELVMKHRTKC